MDTAVTSGSGHLSSAMNTEEQCGVHDNSAADLDLSSDLSELLCMHVVNFIAELRIDFSRIPISYPKSSFVVHSSVAEADDSWMQGKPKADVD
jgi:hypothetical protein